MQEFDYQLSKEDYLDWIHWNVGRQNLKKAQRITVLVFVAFLAIYIIGNIVSKRSLSSMIPSLLLMVALGFFMLHSVSAKHQEKVIWKRSGLAKLEKSGGFPHVHLTVKGNGITMEVPGEVRKEYSYADIKEIAESDRLLLLAAASDNTWQFVAKSTFRDEEEMQEFKALMEEKIEDARENPEKYRKKPERRAISEDLESGAGTQAGAAAGGKEDAVYIEPVDTSHMGKIGKMAHIMAAMAADGDGGEAAVGDTATGAELSEAEDAGTEPSETEDAGAEPAEPESCAASEPLQEEETDRTAADEMSQTGI